MFYHRDSALLTTERTSEDIGHIRKLWEDTGLQVEAAQGLATHSCGHATPWQHKTCWRHKTSERLSLEPPARKNNLTQPRRQFLAAPARQAPGPQKQPNAAP